MNLTDYNELKRQFDTTVQDLLDREKKTDIEQLHRRKPIKYISALIKKLDEKLGSTPDQEALGMASSILYGAMSLVTADIDASLERRPAQRFALNTLTLGIVKKPGSELRDGLNAAMGISPTTTPSTAQYYDNQRKLNQFTKFIFVRNDSRLGIKPKLSADHVAIMAEYIAKSYEREASYHDEIIADNAATKKTTIAPTDMNSDLITAAALKIAKAYKKEKSTTENLASLLNWNDLKRGLVQLIHDECVGKGVTIPSELPNKVRAAQLIFLQTTAEILTQTTELADADKTAILAGTVHIVREQIGVGQYAKEILSTDDTPSFVHSWLTTIVHAKISSAEQTEAMVLAANHFIKYMTTEAEQLHINHLYSSITRCSIPEILKMSQNIIKTCRCTALDRAVADFRASCAATEKVTSASGEASPTNEFSFWNSKPTAPAVENSKQVAALK